MDTIVFCGVAFMGESAILYNKNKDNNIVALTHSAPTLDVSIKNLKRI